MEVKIKKLYKDSKIPYRGSAVAAGYDLYAYIPEGQVEIKPSQTVILGTGVSMALPENIFGAVYARSGMAIKRGLRPANCTAVIDADYRGEYLVALYNDGNETQIVEHGDRIAQLVLTPYQVADFIEVDELDETNRGDGGFGSTGAN